MTFWHPLELILAFIVAVMLWLAITACTTVVVRCQATATAVPLAGQAICESARGVR